MVYKLRARTQSPIIKSSSLQLFHALDQPFRIGFHKPIILRYTSSSWSSIIQNNKPLTKLASPIYLSTFCLVLQSALGNDPLGQSCSNSANFTTRSSPYQSNLNTLVVSYLSFSTPMTGFGLGVIGQSPYQAYELASCGPNISSTDCKACVVNATAQIRKSCSHGKQATIWCDKCLLRYSDENFFGHIDNSVQIILLSTKNASDPLIFMRKATGLLRKLAKEATEASRFFATGEVGTGGDDKIYELAQCTRDLSCGDCSNCLEELIGELPSDGKQGARIVGGSCNIRYEMYPFVGA